MNEELKVIISAEMDKLKRGIGDAKREIGGFKDEVRKASANADTNIQKLGKGIGNAVKAGAKVATAAAASVTTAIGGIVTASVKNYAEYEQLTGGVEKLFGTSADVVMKYAQSAYKNAGLSANDYMEQITGFSASLISSLGGDTAKAAEVGNMAVEDMSDNANVFGTSIESIQNAYNGFAKGNYGMLDNLKLGYGGCKEEMERLIEDANKTKVAMGEVGDLSIDSYADIIEAIHTVQTEMKITGTTSREAEGTISGSIEMTKAAWQNFITGLADSEADIPTLVSNVVSSASSVMENILPIAKEVIAQLPAAISEISPEAGAAFQTIVDAITAVLPILQDALSGAFDIITNTINFVSENLGLFEAIAVAIGIITTAIGLYNVVAAIKAAMDAAEVTTLAGLATAQLAAAQATIVALAPYLAIAAAIAAVIAIIVLCIKNWDKIKETTTKVAKAIKEAVVNMASSVKEKFTSMKNDMVEKIESAKSAVSEKFNAIKTGITEKVNSAKSTVTSTFNSIKTAITTPINSAKTTVLSTFESIKSGITNKINSAKEAVTNAVNKVKSIMSGTISFPHIKVPHFNISGGVMPWGIGGMGTKPTISVSWYAKGGVFDKTTLFHMGGLGEAGAEAIVPLEKNTQWLDRIATMLNDKMGGGSSQIVLNVDGKTFAETSVKTINDLTRQRGSLPLVLV